MSALIFLQLNRNQRRLLVALEKWLKINQICQFVYGFNRLITLDSWLLTENESKQNQRQSNGKCEWQTEESAFVSVSRWFARCFSCKVCIFVSNVCCSVFSNENNMKYLDGKHRSPLLFEKTKSVSVFVWMPIDSIQIERIHALVDDSKLPDSIWVIAYDSARESYETELWIMT